MREKTRQTLRRNEQKKSKSKRGRPAGYSPAIKKDPAYWEGKLKELGLTMERGAPKKLLYDHKANFGMDEENGTRFLLHQALERDEELGKRAVSFYVELSNERENLAWRKVLKDEKLLTASNRRLIARKSAALKSLLDRDKITKSVYEQVLQTLIPAALAWQAIGLHEDDEFDPEIDASVPSN
jgi:hypothetical protein